MRRKLLLGMGLASVLSGSVAVGQFPAPTAPAAPFGGGQPVGTPSQPVGQTIPPVGGLNTPGYTPPGVAKPNGFQPASVSAPTPAANPAAGAIEIPSALGPNHAWAVRPETGAFFICVKSYSRPSRPDPNDPGPSAKDLAEGLAGEIRNTFQVGAYLYEYISDERKVEAAAIAAARQRQASFTASVDTLRQKSQLQGMDFLEPDTRIRFKTINYRDQIAVLVGPFQTEADALKALARVKTWPAPKDTRLMDGGAIVKPGPGGQPVIEKSYLNPYLQAMVVQNPAIAKAPGAQAGDDIGIDPFLIKLNEGRPYSLLSATKGWTLAVKSFTAPVTIQSKDQDLGVMRKMGTSKGADVLAAGAEQAEALVRALREMKGPGGQPLGLEAFVLHTRNASLVTVGQFDSPNDPQLLEVRRILTGMRLNVSRDASGQVPTGEKPEMFPNVFPIPIPRVNRVANLPK